VDSPVLSLMFIIPFRRRESALIAAIVLNSNLRTVFSMIQFLI
jgi:hypothetical protein